MYFDLDPSADDFNAVRQAALYLRELLSELGLEPFVKTTGSRGVHVITPLDRDLTFDDARTFAQKVAQVLANRYPEEVTNEQRKKKRGSRVFIDTLRNSYGQTAVTPYAVRAKQGAPVAMPLDWDELKNQKVNSQSYNIKNVLIQLSQKKNPWQGMWRHAYSLREAMDKLDKFRQS
jgi:bifunctional non-homologous end joining protein LigD